jgi:hypothetical protein
MAKTFTLGWLLLMLAAPCPPQGGVTTDNTAKPIGSGRWEWTVFVNADPATLSQIHCVEYLLHPTFPDRDRKVCDRGSIPGQAFSLTANGWGTFDIPVTVFFNDGKTQTLTHHLSFDKPALASGVASLAPAGCKVAGSFSMSERSIQALGTDWPGVYLYAEEIHRKLPSHFNLIKSAKPFQPGTFNWSQHSIGLKKRTALSNADTDAYIKLLPAPGKPIPIALSGPRATLNFTDPQEHKSIAVFVCK